MKFKYSFINAIFIFVFIFFILFPHISFASNEITIDSEACILIDISSGKTLYEKDANKKLYPASTTKVMTAILTVENCNLQDEVTVSYWSINSVPATYTMGHIKPGQVLTVEELLNITMIASANDAAFALAEYIVNLDNPNYLKDSSIEAKQSFDESIAEFSNMMNKKAKELGCINTNFVNPNGIHDENHYSTAYDLSLIGKYAYSNGVIRSIASKVSYDLPKNAVNNFTKYTNTNALLRNSSKYYYEYANGFKTGYTDAAGFCIIATAKKDNIDLLAVVLNGRYLEDGTASRESDCIKLFNYGFTNYTTTSLISEGDIARTIDVINGTDESKSLDLISADSLNCLVQKDEIIDATPTVSINTVFAPIAKGQVVGTITYTIDSIEYSSELIASHDVYSSSVMDIILLLLCTFLVLLLLVTVLSISKKNKSEN